MKRRGKKINDIYFKPTVKLFDCVPPLLLHLPKFIKFFTNSFPNILNRDVLKIKRQPQK